VLLMTPSALSAELAAAHIDDLRRSAERPHLDRRPHGSSGFFRSQLRRVRADFRRLQLGPSDAVVCPC
jgi:hypothetical protein